MSDDYKVFDLDAARKKSRRKNAPPPPGPDDSRPVIKLVNGRIKASVDAVELALIKRGGLYQNANRIVFVGEAPMQTHDDREVMASRIFERGENALAEDIAEAACLVRYDARADADLPTNAPAWFVRTLQQRVGRFRLSVLAGVISAPTLRRDGSLLDVPGYDAKSGLLYDPRGVIFSKIPPKPDRRAAEQALATLNGLIEEFPFESEADCSVALSAILTACARQAMRTAPLHAFTAPAAGTGKSKIVDLASTISTGREAGVISQVADEAEMEKRLSSMFLQGAGAIAIDNCTAALDGAFLCTSLTQTSNMVRPLGSSKQIEVPTKAFISATGNNLSVKGDMTRRTIVCRLDAQMERPELRTFDFEPVAQAKADRVRYVTAALTILLAFKAAGSPRQSNPLGSFEDWSLMVRDALIWLGCADPVATMEQGRASDPALSELGEVLTQWRKVIGTERTTVRKVIERATRQTPAGYGSTRLDFDHPDLREALLSVAGHGGAINGKMLGKWLTAHEKQIAANCCVYKAGSVEGTMTWKCIDQR